MTIRQLLTQIQDWWIHRHAMVMSNEWLKINGATKYDVV